MYFGNINIPVSVKFLVLNCNIKNWYSIVILNETFCSCQKFIIDIFRYFRSNIPRTMVGYHPDWVFGVLTKSPSPTATARSTHTVATVWFWSPVDRFTSSSRSTTAAYTVETWKISRQPSSPWALVESDRLQRRIISRGEMVLTTRFLKRALDRLPKIKIPRLIRQVLKFRPRLRQFRAMALLPLLPFRQKSSLLMDLPEEIIWWVIKTKPRSLFEIIKVTSTDLRFFTLSYTLLGCNVDVYSFFWFDVRC